jgi:hypothetical protein
MQFKYVELSFTFPAELSASILAADEAERYDELVTLFSDEGGIVAAVTVTDAGEGGDYLTIGEALDTAIDMAAEVLFEHTPAETPIPDPWSSKVVDRELMSEYFQQVAVAPALPPCGPVEGDGLAGVAG